MASEDRPRAGHTSALERALPVKSRTRCVNDLCALVEAYSGATRPRPYLYLCIHTYNPDTDKYQWSKLYDCEEYAIVGNVTWYINNQTPGTRARFWYKHVDEYWYSPGAFSKGRPGGPWYWGPADEFVKPC